jgi:riboflavin kinase/FMN adenylyltransferase
MHIIRHLEALPAEARGGAVSIGNFDGVHRGHIAIVRRLLERARQVGGRAVVFTFDPHPVRILRPDQCPPPLTWTERKAELLARQGVDWIVAYPTDEALLSLSAAEFFDRIVRDALAARALVEGPNFFFGHNREGTIDRLRELAAAAEISLDVVPPVVIDGAIVSSSRVRDLIRAGDVEQAARLLSAPYRIRGMVTHGAGRGAKIGFPTANLEAIDTLLPAQGVYAGRAWVADASWPAAINLGPSPTFGDSSVRVEVHVIGLDEPLYGQPLEVDFLARLRDIRPFDSPDCLAKQLARDIEDVKRITAANSQPPAPSPLPPARPCPSTGAD